MSSATPPTPNPGIVTPPDHDIFDVGNHPTFPMSRPQDETEVSDFVPNDMPSISNDPNSFFSHVDQVGGPAFNNGVNVDLPAWANLPTMANLPAMATRYEPNLGYYGSLDPALCAPPIPAPYLNFDPALYATSNTAPYATIDPALLCEPLPGTVPVATAVAPPVATAAAPAAPAAPAASAATVVAVLAAPADLAALAAPALPPAANAITVAAPPAAAIALPAMIALPAAIALPADAAADIAAGLLVQDNGKGKSKATGKGKAKATGKAKSRVKPTSTVKAIKTPNARKPRKSGAAHTTVDQPPHTPLAHERYQLALTAGPTGAGLYTVPPDFHSFWQAIEETWVTLGLTVGVHDRPTALLNPDVHPPFWNLLNHRLGKESGAYGVNWGKCYEALWMMVKKHGDDATWDEAAYLIALGYRAFIERDGKVYQGRGAPFMAQLGNELVTALYEGIGAVPGPGPFQNLQESLKETFSENEAIWLEQWTMHSGSGSANAAQDEASSGGRNDGGAQGPSCAGSH